MALESVKRAGWRVKAWREAVDVSHTQVCKFIREGTVASAKIGAARRILESPESFLARHADR